MNLVVVFIVVNRVFRIEKALQAVTLQGFFLVEVTGFEPATFWSRTKRATKLRYTSTWFVKSWSQ